MHLYSLFRRKVIMEIELHRLNVLKNMAEARGYEVHPAGYIASGNIIIFNPASMSCFLHKPVNVLEKTRSDHLNLYKVQHEDFSGIYFLHDWMVKREIS